MAALTRGLQRSAETVLTAFLMLFSLALLWPVAHLRRKYLAH